MDKTPKPSAYSYIRMSTQKQLKGNSLERQTELSAKYAAENGLCLVEDFDLTDIGVSAYTGANVTTGALGKFLKAIEEGKIPQGSFLLVESLDRISRESIDAALRLFLSITSSGINIVTLSDGQVYRSGKADATQIMLSIFIMSRAYEESKTKSQRIAAAWKGKRERISSTKMTKHAPNWLVLNADRTVFELVPDRAKIVVKIFKLASEGRGVYRITKTLNASTTPPFGRSVGWHESYVEKILKNRAVLGEFQPYTSIEGKRTAVGEPVQNYYPALISEELFLRVQADKKKRSTGAGGRKGKSLKNLFTHIATCKYCGKPMRMVDKGSGPKGGRYLKCSGAVRGMGCYSKAWRYEDFEKLFLTVAKEVDLASVLNAEEENSARVKIENKLIAEREKLSNAEFKQGRTNDLLGDPNMDLDSLRKLLADCNIEIGRAKASIQALEVEMATQSKSKQQSPSDLLSLIKELGSLPEEKALQQRTKLAKRLRDIISSLEVATEGNMPKDLLMVEEFRKQGMEQDAIDKLIENQQAGAKGTQSYNHSFVVKFVDGTVRTATMADKGIQVLSSESHYGTDGKFDSRRFGELVEGNRSDQLLPTDENIAKLLEQSFPETGGE